jgi:hypothetical integral membrane protein (TIGR02206 family)
VRGEPATGACGPVHRAIVGGRGYSERRLDTFRPFSPTHALVNVTFVAVAALFVRLRRRRGDGPAGRRLDAWLAGVTGVIAAGAVLWPMMPWHFKGDWSWPLHVCDVTVMAVPFALVSGRRWLRAIVYCWGLGLSTQSFVTPDLLDGPARVGFWMFWGAHFAIVGTAIYDVAARGFRPAWRDAVFTAGVGIAYIAALFALDAATGWNYGFVGPSAPGQPTLVDALGPWPLRALWVALLGVAAIFIAVAPWEIARALRQRGAIAATTAVGTSPS